ncbi:MAG: hypothetical protein ACC628_11360 [Pirellulaceae bacterium]
MQSRVGIDGFTGKKVLYFVRYKQSGENYVYHSEFVHGRWTKAEKVLIGADKQPIGGEPSLTGDGKYLYIGVDAGGPDQRQLDIGFAERQADGRWKLG